MKKRIKTLLTAAPKTGFGPRQISGFYIKMRSIEIL
jgi:hypothetical protein